MQFRTVSGPSPVASLNHRLKFDRSGGGVGMASLRNPPPVIIPRDQLNISLQTVDNVTRYNRLPGLSPTVATSNFEPKYGQKRLHVLKQKQKDAYISQVDIVNVSYARSRTTQRAPRDRSFFRPTEPSDFKELKPSWNPHYLRPKKQVQTKEQEGFESLSSIQRHIEVEAESARRTARSSVKMSQSFLPQIDQRLYKNEVNVAKMKELIRNHMRKQELTDWADHYDPSRRRKGSFQSKQLIGNETEFLLSVKEKYITKRNDIAARTLQRCLKALMVRRRYVKYRNYIVGAAVRIQRFFKNRKFLQKMRIFLQGREELRAQQIQKYMRGYLVNKMISNRRTTIMMELTSQMDSIINRHGLDLKIKLLYQWKKYKKKKEKKKKKKGKATGKGKKGAKGKTGSSTAAKSSTSKKGDETPKSSTLGKSFKAELKKTTSKAEINLEPKKASPEKVEKSAESKPSSPPADAEEESKHSEHKSQTEAEPNQPAPTGEGEEPKEFKIEVEQVPPPDEALPEGEGEKQPTPPASPREAAEEGSEPAAVEKPPEEPREGIEEIKEEENEGEESENN